MFNWVILFICLSNPHAEAVRLNRRFLDICCCVAKIARMCQFFHWKSSQGKQKKAKKCSRLLCCASTRSVLWG